MSEDAKPSAPPQPTAPAEPSRRDTNGSSLSYATSNGSSGPESKPNGVTSKQISGVRSGRAARGGEAILQFIDVTKEVDVLPMFGGMMGPPPPPPPVDGEGTEAPSGAPPPRPGGWRSLLPFCGPSASVVKRKRVLHGVSGRAVPGEVLVLMGPSGSGKTTLLNSLHPERRGAHVGGRVTINGFPLVKAMKRKIAYVLQEDLFFIGLTVRETLTFTARLRLPMTEAEKAAEVDKAIACLGLTSCADTPIMLCSGGEKKRTSIATEMLTDPSLLLLDEPTSGLDSTTAAALMSTLKRVAQEDGRTIVSSIHQPASQVFFSMDTVLLLAEGRTVFYGPPGDAMSYFSTQGFECPAGYNAADFIMDLVIGQGSEDNKDRLVDAYANGECATAFLPGSSGSSSDAPPGGAVAARVAGDEAAVRRGRSRGLMASFSTLIGRPGAVAPATASTFRLRSIGEDLENGRAEDEAEAEPVDEGDKWASGWLYQTRVLTRRSFRVARAETLTMLNLIQCLLLAGISGILWLRLAWTESEVLNRSGFIFFIMTFWPFQALFSALLTFPNERPILAKERASGAYRLSAYFWAKTAAEMPLRLLFPTLYQCIAYWMVGVRDSFPIFLGFVAFELMAVITAESIGFFIGTAFANMRQALVVASVTMLTLMLLGGFFIRNIPSWIGWIRYISFFKYSNDSAQGLVYGDAPTPCDGSGILPACGNSDVGFATTDEVRDYLNIQGSVAFNAGILLGLAVVIRIGAYCNLRYIKEPIGGLGGPPGMMSRR